MNLILITMKKKRKQGEYITGSFETKDLLNANPKSNIIPKVNT